MSSETEKGLTKRDFLKLSGLGLVISRTDLLVDPPTVLASTCECPANTDPLAKYEWNGNAWVFEEEKGRANAIDITDDANSGDWKVREDYDYSIKAMATKAGKNCHHTDYDPRQSSGTYSNEIVGGKEISHLEFCIPESTAVGLSCLAARSQPSRSLKPLASVGTTLLATIIAWAIRQRNSRKSL